MSVHAQSSTNYQVDISTGKHHFVADEPIGIGDDAGPSPYDLLPSALASCMIITVQMYAQRKNWPLERVEMVCDVDSAEEQLPNGSKKRSANINTQLCFQGDLSPSVCTPFLKSQNER